MEASVISKTQGCKHNNIAEFLDWAHQHRLHAKDVLPASEVILCEYAAEFRGKLAGASVKAKLSAIKGWTIMKGYTWQGGDCLRKVLTGVERSAPPSSFRPEREPVKKSHLSILHAELDLSDTNGLDCCIAAAADLMFYSQLRAGEILPTNSSFSQYNTKFMPKISDLSKTNAAGLKRLFLPRTKTSQMRGDKVMTRSSPTQTLKASNKFSQGLYSYVAAIPSGVVTTSAAALATAFESEVLPTTYSQESIQMLFKSLGGGNPRPFSNTGGISNLWLLYIYTDIIPNNPTSRESLPRMLHAVIVAVPTGNSIHSYFPTRITFFRYSL
ncbi:MAG: hypothetical protein NXY57DRAFT_969322 [Lentinula lateritia]|nr:MAG: hypothetical protein NXY57DRAFT_969322 [Lentinula lateritia]